MSNSVKNAVLMGFSAATLLAGCAPNVAPPKTMTQPRATAPSVSTVFQDKQAYMAQRFTLGVLPQQTQDTVLQAGSAPVSFDRLLLVEKVTYTKAGSDAPTQFTNSVVLENAGNGLVRSVNTTQSNGFDISTYFDLSYRGVYILRSQKFAASATAWPPLIEAKEVSHYDTDLSAAHINFTYRNGYAGHSQMSNPMQSNCTAGQRYSASTLNPNADGMAREIACQWTNGNGVASGTGTYIYLEKYGVALLMRTQSASGQIQVNVTGFKVE